MEAEQAGSKSLGSQLESMTIRCEELDQQLQKLSKLPQQLEELKVSG